MVARGASALRRSTSRASAGPSKPVVKDAAADAGEDGVAVTESKAAMNQEPTTTTTNGAAVPATPSRAKGKRSRVSDIHESDEAQDGEAATPRTLRQRNAKSPAPADTPAAAKSASKAKSKVAGSVAGTPRAAKKPRVSAPPKPLKQGMNGLAGSFAVINDPALQQLSFQPAYTITSQVDPRKDGNPPLAAFIFGTGDMGQFGLGTEMMDEILVPKIHNWFQEHSGGKKQSNGQAMTNGADEADKPQMDKTTETTLGPYGLEQIACGGMHTLAVDSLGRVWSWGINDNGALGRNTANPPEGMTTEDLETQPMLVEKLREEGFRAVRVAAGDSISVAIDATGDVRAWGSFRAAQEGLIGFDGTPGSAPIQFTPVRLAAFKGQAIYQVACGANHVLALTSDGHVFAHGVGEQNQLGRRVIARRQISGLIPERLALKKIVHVAAGSFHSFAVDDKGNVYGWGLNQFRQTGVADEDAGYEESISAPTKVRSLDPKLHNGSKVIQIACGDLHSVFLFDSGEVYACGNCASMQIGLSSEHETMKELKAAKDEVKKQRREWIEEEVQKRVAAGKNEAEARSQAEYDAADALLMPGDIIPEPLKITFPSPKLVQDGKYAPTNHETKIVRIATSLRHNLAVGSLGELYSWGQGLVGELGLRDETEVETPTQVVSKDLKEYQVIDASAGGQHCMLVAGKSKAGAP